MLVIRFVRHWTLFALAASLSTCSIGQTASPAGPARSPVTEAGPHLQPPPSEGAAVSGKYRNLFVELGKPADEVEQKLERAYQSLFHGDPANESVMFEAGQNDSGKLAYILDINNGDVRSEGMSYGMMIAVQHNQKEDFDALWNWAKTFMYHADPTHPAYGYFSWQMHPDGSAMDEMPAADGEEYFATALLFAEHRFGGGEGMYAYGEQATKLLSDMKNRAAIEGTVNGGRKTKGVALWNPEQKMVRFTPDSGNFESNGDHTDPSYHLPAFYELWARWGPQADRPFWADAAKVSRDYFVEVTNPKTGLAPDYGNFDGSPKAASWDAHTIDFRYDAWRTAMNWSVDAAWWAKDPRENELSNKLLRFFRSVGKVYPNTYRLDGTPTSQSSSSGLSAMNAVAALAATDPVASQYVEALWQQPIPTGKYRYYDGMLHLLAMLHVSGEFRVYGSVQ